MEVEILSRGIINEQYLDDIAVAINAKLGSSSTMTPSEMASKISSIPTSSGASLGHGSFSANGSYRALDDNLDGYSTVDVSIPMTMLSANSNGIYTPSVGGYNQVNVNVPTTSLTSLSVSANGSYVAPSGYSYDEITVNVSGTESDYDFYEDGIDLTVTAAEVYLSTSTSSNAFYDQYCDQHINTLTIEGNTERDVLQYLNRYPYKTISFKKLILDETITEIGSNVINNFFNYKELVIENPNIKINQGNSFKESGLIKITFPNLIGSNFSWTGSYTFDRCYNLKTVTLPTNLTNISSTAFRYCYNLKNINLSDLNSLNIINTCAFNNCNNLEKVENSNVTTINGAAFQNCLGLRKVNFPNVFTLNGTEHFRGCENLEEITLSTSLTAIPGSCFHSCYKLLSFDFSNITTIGVSAFANCYNLKELILPNTLTTLNSQCFLNNVGLNKLELYNSITSLATDAFKGASTPSTIIFHGTQTEWETLVSGKTMLKDIDPTTVTYVTD